jgi:hypothetical protein
MRPKVRSHALRAGVGHRRQRVVLAQRAVKIEQASRDGKSGLCKARTWRHGFTSSASLGAPSPRCWSVRPGSASPRIGASPRRCWGSWRRLVGPRRASTGATRDSRSCSGSCPGSQGSPFSCWSSPRAGAGAGQPSRPCCPSGFRSTTRRSCTGQSGSAIQSRAPSSASVPSPSGTRRSRVSTGASMTPREGARPPPLERRASALAPSH